MVSWCHLLAKCGIAYGIPDSCPVLYSAQKGNNYFIVIIKHLYSDYDIPGTV